MTMTGLRCLRCGRRYPPEPDAYLCVDCGTGESRGDDPGILDVEYDDDRAADRLRDAAEPPRGDLFRYLPLLPIAGAGPGLPAGGTPLVPAPRLAARLGLRALYIKDETRNPTRCLKDRATAVAVTIAAARGRTEVYCASAGNAAISLAGFAAALGWRCHVYVPAHASAVRLAWLRRYGADVHVSAGDYDEAYAEAEDAGRANGWYSRNCAFNPFLVEGKKTVSHEIADQLGGRAPDWVVAPVGDGCTLGAIGKGFREAVRVGRLDRAPRLLGVQSAAVRPLVDRFHDLPPMAGQPGTTRAHSIAVRRPRNALRLIAELEAADGRLVAVADPEIAEAQRLLALEAGIVAEFTSAATLAGLFLLHDEGRLAGRTAVLVVTGGRLDDEG